MNALTTHTTQSRPFGMAALSLASLLILSTVPVSASAKILEDSKQPVRGLGTETGVLIAEKPEGEVDGDLKNFFEKLEHIRHERHRGRHHGRRHHGRHHHGRHHGHHYRGHHF